MLEARSLLSAAVVAAAAGTQVLPELLNGHNVVVDGNNKLLSWVDPQDKAYDAVMRLAWGFLENSVTVESNGLKTYYTYSQFHDTPPYNGDVLNNPAGKNAMLTEAALGWYAYSGDTAAIAIVKGLLDYQLSSKGTTPADYNWANIPYSTADGGNLQYGTDNTIEGIGVIEPDKVGELGTMYLKFYEYTGDVAYRNAAIDCANALASHVTTGDATHSPWPFRVNAQTGAATVNYTASVIGPIELFDTLIARGYGNVAGYQTARQTAWNWLMTYPMKNNDWANYFEDVGAGLNETTNLNQYSPMMTARYILEHPEIDPNWQSDVRGLIAFVENHFGQSTADEPGVFHGARLISEQDSYNFKMESHTGRFAAANALLYELTGDQTAKDTAFRSYNWATYMASADGTVIEGPAKHAINPNLWYTDGYGDFVRNFIVGMGAVPEWAPAGEDHLLRSSSVVQSVSYQPGDVSYTTFDNSATEVLRISFVPQAVTANGAVLSQRNDLTQAGWMYDPATGVLRIRHDGANSIRVSGTPIATYQLTVLAENGSVTKSPDQSVFASGAQVTLTATANAGFQFGSWSGDLTGPTNPATIVMDGNKTVAANFVAVSGNAAPTVNAGQDVTITLPANSVALNGTATDDGLPNPPGALTLAWSQVSGPGTVTFSNAASGTSTATFSGAGVYVLRLTAGDGQLSASDDVTVTVNPVPTGTAQSVWSAKEKPSRASDASTKAMELGLMFKANVAGVVTGVRFYKGAQNTGKHSGHLWTADGTLLAGMTFKKESKSGWQQASFTTPVAITPDSNYVISYRAPKGRYAATAGYFAQPMVRGSLTAINGVYAYKTATMFPTKAWRNANYWVDVVFVPSSAAAAPLADVIVARAAAKPVAHDGILSELFSTRPVL